MQTNAQFEPMNKKGLSRLIQRHGVRFSVLLASLAQAQETLRRHGIVDPKMVGAFVKDKKIEIAIRHCEALNDIRPAKLEGVIAKQGKRPGKTLWRLAVNDRCAVVWHRLDPVH